MEEKKGAFAIAWAMEALLHICRDGCRTIGSCDKVLKGGQVACGFPACKGLETLVCHFSNCKIRVPGGCVHCKRMCQLLELNSCLCNDPDSCKVLFASKHETSIFASMPFIVWGKFMISPIPTPKKKSDERCRMSCCAHVSQSLKLTFPQ